MSSIGFVLIPLMLPIVAVLNTLATRRKTASESFLVRAREVAPVRVTQEYDMVVWPWRFWRWARTLDPSISDPQLFVNSALLKKLDRIWLAIFVVTLVASAATITWYPWRS